MERLSEFKRIGENEFLRKYSSGARPRKHYLEHGGERFPLKAVWAAAHRPPIHTRTFSPDQAMAGLRRLGFDKFWPDDTMTDNSTGDISEQR